MIDKPQRSVILAVLDGWGVDQKSPGNAVELAKKPSFDYLWNNFPRTLLGASGMDVGLPKNAPGNSEAGHLNIGAGRIVHQDIKIINDEISTGNFYRNRQLNTAFDHAQENNSNLHLIGLLGEGGNHAHNSHIVALLKLAKIRKFNKVFIHLFTDGRDTGQMSAINSIIKLERSILEIGIGKIATICGRYYAMDRDHRWGRTSRAYNALVGGQAESFSDPKDGIEKSYQKKITDEFIIPFQIVNKGMPNTRISKNDSVIFFNFRSDRMKQLTEAFLVREFNSFSDHVYLNNLFFVTFLTVADDLDTHPAFKNENLNDTLSHVISQNGCKQLHIAETEKYAHVTYFFDGQNQHPILNEKRILIPSPKAVTYDYTPRMSADKITDYIIKFQNAYSFILLNYANADMVGHTGNLSATIKAVEAVDDNLGKMITLSKQTDSILILTGDHGNAERMINQKTGEADTEHTNNPVPFIFADFSRSKLNMIKLSHGRLSDIAPTILNYINLDRPNSMNNRVLWKKI